MQLLLTLLSSKLEFSSENLLQKNDYHLVITYSSILFLMYGSEMNSDVGVERKITKIYRALVKGIIDNNEVFREHFDFVAPSLFIFLLPLVYNVVNSLSYYTILSTLSFSRNYVE